jgi:tetratricopeptide (TPR) repeat protein
LVLVGVLTCIGWLGHVFRQTAAAEAALRNGEDQLLHQHYAEALDLFRSGSALAEDAPFGGQLRHGLSDGAKRAERGRAAAELHLLCERVRGAYESDDLTVEQARDMEDQCRNLWQQRARIAEQLSLQSERGLDEQIQSDLLDLAILSANVHVRQAPAGDSAARLEAIVILDDAKRLLGARRVLAYERGAQALALGRTEEADAAARQATELTPRDAWEHYALGRAYLRAGDLAKAAWELDLALEKEPQSFWANFTKGVCASRGGQFSDALGAFSACVVLAPHSAPCFFNRGRVYAELSRFDAALRDLNRALELDPSLTAATLARADVYRRLQRFDEALADLDRVARTGGSDATVCYRKALVHLDLGDRPAARASLQEALRFDPENELAMELLGRLRQPR